MNFIRGKILDRYLIDFPEGFVELPGDGEIYGFEEDKHIQVYCKKASAEEAQKDKFFNLIETKDKSDTDSVGDITVLKELSKEVDGNRQILANTVIHIGEEYFNNWSFVEKVDDDIYAVSVRYRNEDQDNAKLAFDIVNSIVKCKPVDIRTVTENAGKMQKIVDMLRQGV